MEKKWLIIIVFSVALIVFFVAVPVLSVSDIYDVDNDGDIDIFDVQWIFQHIGDYDELYDMDEDGDVDIFDVQLAFGNIGNIPEEYQTIVEWLVDVEWS